MESALSIRIAEIVMLFLENKINSFLSKHIYFWKRYVDDIFIITSQPDINIILDYANSLCPSYQFTFEIAENHKLPFIDILIEHSNVNEQLNFITSVYRKPTFSGQYLNFNSINPITHKLTVIGTLFHREKYYCIKEDLLKIELNRIFSDLKLKCYPPPLIKRVFNETFFFLPLQN